MWLQCGLRGCSTSSGERWTEVEEQETQMAKPEQERGRLVEDQRGARADAGLSSRPNVSYGRPKGTVERVKSEKGPLEISSKACVFETYLKTTTNVLRKGER